MSRAPRPTFVIGPYRSGTSILTWAIGQHPNIWPLEETGWIGLYGTGALAGYDVVRSAPRNYFDINQISLAEYMAHAGGSIDEFILTTSARQAENLGSANGAASKRRWVDGTPGNTYYIPLLRHLFPAAKFLFLLRDPIDTVASLVHFDRAGGKPMTISTAMSTWLRMANNGLLAYRAFGPDVVKIVPYAELIERPGEVLEAIFTFIGEAHVPEAELMMRNRINSSHVTAQERAKIQRAIERNVSSIAKRLTRCYGDYLALSSAPWIPSDAALCELESLQRLLTSTFVSPRFAVVRWIARRLREKVLGPTH